MKDIIILTADNNVKQLLSGLLPRIPLIEKTAEFTYDIEVHPRHDSGIVNESHTFLRPFSDQYKYAIVICDQEGSGRESENAEKIEQEIEEKLSENGWGKRGLAIVVHPEIENWVWVNAAQLHNALDWSLPNDIYDWLVKYGWKKAEELKPKRPKEAFESTLKLSKIPRSSSLYKEICSAASYKLCKDRAFLKLRNMLIIWFKK